MTGVSEYALSPAIAPHPTLHRYYDNDAERRGFVQDLFDGAAIDYDRIEGIMAFGSGPRYRREALTRAGLAPGMRVLDVATGTGLVARQEVDITGDRKLVVGLDPSIGMLSRAVNALRIPAMQGIGERIPLVDQCIDFLSMGYALRHMADLTAAFREFSRVLKPGGRICILELTAPPPGLKRVVLRFYMRYVIPLVCRLWTRNPESRLLWQYYWDTIEACVLPQNVMDALTAAGFTNIRRNVELGMFSEYTAQRPQ